MKNLFLFLLLSVFVGRASAQQLPIDAGTNKVAYSEIVTVSGQSQKQLFTKAQKWILGKNSTANPYAISLDNATDGSITGKGSFSLPVDRRKYTVQFVINIACKDGKIRYSFMDLVIQFKTQAGSSGGGFGYWGGSSYHEAEILEYSLETFYPSRLTSKKPVIKWYEEIRKEAFDAIDREMQSIASSLKQTMSVKEDW